MTVLQRFLTTEQPSGSMANDVFLEATEQAGLNENDITEFVLTDEQSQPIRGKDGEMLATYVVELGNPCARKTIWITTGVHGIERFAGTHLVADVLANRSQLEQMMGRDLRIVIIEGVNAYGASHGIRETHERIDIMRNCRKTFGEPELPDAYRLADPFINPSDITPRTEGFYLAGLACVALVCGKEVLVNGQQASPDKMIFAGRRPARATLLLGEVVHRFSAGRVEHGQHFHLDIHTGIGRRISRVKEWGPRIYTNYRMKKRGPRVYTDYELDSPEYLLAQQALGQIGVVRPRGSGWLASRRHGTIENIFEWNLPPRAPYTGVCVELGTGNVINSTLAVLRSSWRNRAVRKHPDRYTEYDLEEARRRMFEVFWPCSSEWRHDVVHLLRSGLLNTIAMFGAKA